MFKKHSVGIVVGFFLGLSLFAGCTGGGGQDYGGGAVGAAKSRDGGVNPASSENIGYPGQGPGGAGARSLDNTGYEGQ